MYIPKEIHTRLILDVSELGFVIEDILGDLLGQYEEGLYLPNQRTPLFSDNKEYYLIKHKKNEIIKEKITNFNKVVGTIVDEDMNPITTINKSGLLHRVLLEEPNQAFHGIDFIKEYAYSYVFNLVQWGNFPKKNLSDIIHKLMNSKGLEFVIQENDESPMDLLLDQLSHRLIDLNTDIYDFMNKDYMNMYDIEVKHTHLHITKMQDYRIYEFEKLKKELDHGDGE